MSVKESYPKKTIYLTAELIRDLDEFREIINVSEICKEALTERVETLKRARKGVKENMPKTIKRLKTERKKSQLVDFEYGERSGYKDASILSYGTLKQTVELYEKKEASYDPQYDIPKWLREFVIDELEGDEIPNDEQEYFRGWLNGVAQFWNEVKGKIEG